MIGIGAMGDPKMENVFIHPTACVDEPVEIGLGTRIWHFSHIRENACIGPRSIIGQNVYVGKGVRLGCGVKLQNNVSVYEGVVLEDYVFCGPSAVFTNVINPRAAIDRKSEVRKTLVCRGATVGANATIVCGHTVGAYAFVAAGAVVTRDVGAYSLVMGVPAGPVGWVCRCGERLELSITSPIRSLSRCQACSRSYRRSSIGLEETPGSVRV